MLSMCILCVCVSQHYLVRIFITTLHLWFLVFYSEYTLQICFTIFLVPWKAYNPWFHHLVRGFIRGTPPIYPCSIPSWVLWNVCIPPKRIVYFIILHLSILVGCHFSTSLWGLLRNQSSSHYNGRSNAMPWRPWSTGAGATTNATTTRTTRRRPSLRSRKPRQRKWNHQVGWGPGGRSFEATRKLRK